jgi:isochorismate hydrolase
MRWRRLALLTAFYLILDLTNPFMGCAFNFNAEESMEGVSRQHERLRHQARTAEVPVRPAAEMTRLAQAALTWRPEVCPVAEWQADLRQGHAPGSDPPSPTEDH